jgi:hypothetical protein
MRRRLLTLCIVVVVMSGTAAAQLGFTSISVVWNQERWKQFTSFKPPSANPALEAALRAPKRVTFIYNAWHLPGLVKDIRVVDLESYVLGRPLKFETSWPSDIYTGPGYVALIETASGEFALVSAMSQFFLIEYRGIYSVVDKPIPGVKR